MTSASLEQLRDALRENAINREAIEQQDRIIQEQQDRITELETQLVAAETEVERLRDTQAALKGAKYVGIRYPIQSPQGVRLGMHVVAVSHEHGPWEAIYCHTEEQARAIEAKP